MRGATSGRGLTSNRGRVVTQHLGHRTAKLGAAAAIKSHLRLL
jgi:hypothetical protein